MCSTGFAASNTTGICKSCCVELTALNSSNGIFGAGGTVSAATLSAGAAASGNSDIIPGEVPTTVSETSS